MRRAITRAGWLLPPGVIIAGTAPFWQSAGCDSSDFEICERTACASKSDLMKKLTSAPLSAAHTSKHTVQCPHDREELGRATWALVRGVFGFRCCACPDADPNIHNRLVHGVYCRNRLRSYTQWLPTTQKSRARRSKPLCGASLQVSRSSTPALTALRRFVKTLSSFHHSKFIL